MKASKDRFQKTPTLYIVMIAAWIALCSALWFILGRGFVSPPFIADREPTYALRAAAVVLLILNGLFISFFWLNGVKDFLYVIWFNIAKRSLYNRYSRVLSAPLISDGGKVIMLYCTCNDFDGNSLEKCIKQNYKNVETVILDDSSKPEYKREVDAFAAQHKLKVVRRANREGFKAGNINHFLNMEETRASDYKYVVILDSDEIIPPDFIKKCLRYFETYDDIGIVQANHVATRNRNFFMKLFHIGVNSHWPTYQTMKNFYGFSSMLGHGAMLRRDCLEKAGGFPDLVAEDLCVSIEMRNIGYRVAFAPDIICQEEYPIDYLAFKKRHSKWTQGNLEFIKKYTGKIFASDMHWYEKLDIVLFTYNLPLTAVFAFYIFLNILILPVLGLDIGTIYPLWLIVPTIIFFFSPMLNDVFCWLFRLNIFAFLFYQICVIILYGSMLFVSLSSATLGLFGKKAVFVVTPKSSGKITFFHALKAHRNEFIFSLILILISMTGSYLGYGSWAAGIFPVLLIASTGILSFFLMFFSNKKYGPERSYLIDENTTKIILRQNRTLKRA